LAGQVFWQKWMKAEVLAMSEDVRYDLIVIGAVRAGMWRPFAASSWE